MVDVKGLPDELDHVTHRGEDESGAERKEKKRDEEIVKLNNMEVGRH